MIFMKNLCALAGVLCLAYSALVFSTRSGTASFLMWILLGAFLIGVMFFLKAGLWEKLPGVLRRCVLMLMVLGSLLFLTVEGCIVSGFFEKGEPGLDYLIVLGAQVRESGPSQVLRYRLDAAKSYLEENENTICIVSGGQGVNEPFSEAEGMYDYLIEQGISPERIIMEDASKSTKENIKNSSVFLNKEKDRVGIVTNNFHVFRGVRLAKHEGFENVSGLAAKAHSVFLPNNMLREFFGVMKDFVQGNL